MKAAQLQESRKPVETEGDVAGEDMLGAQDEDIIF
jgi:hypothetical protein